jgi:hypothetical protein
VAAVATMPGLRPLAFGEILDVGIKLCLRNWRVLVMCVVWLVLPAQIVSVGIILSVSPDALDPTAQQTVETGEETRFVVAQLLGLVVQGAVYLVSTAACFRALADAYLGTEPSAGRSLRFGLRRVPKLLGLYLLYFLAFGLLFGALIGLTAALGPAVLVLLLAAIPAAVYVANAWSLSTPALLFEDAAPAQALKRSYALVKGSWWRVLGIISVGVLLVSILAGVLQGILTLIPATLAEGNEVVLAVAAVIAGTVSVTLTTPFTAAIVALVYFDQRVRREGFDLELLAQGLGTEAPDAASSSAVTYRPPVVTPEQRAQAPFWPPPPGWQPPEPGPAPGTAPAPEPEPEPEGDPPPSAPGGWQPPTPQRWPSESPERGPGGL